MKNYKLTNSVSKSKDIPTMDTEQTQQWETGWSDGSHTTEWGYVDTAAHTTHNTEHRSGARRANTQTDGQLTADGAAVSCRGLVEGRGGTTPQPWSVLSLQGRRTPNFFFSHITSHFRIIGFRTDRGTMKPRLEMQITGLTGIFEVLSCPSVTEPGMWETRTEVGDGKDWWTVYSRHDIGWLLFTLSHKNLPLELKSPAVLSY